ncbi:MAG: guanylate kinase [Gammaproteobacteria bacterium]|jgi:guanylate kinase|nr:guanylate kinase [Gammaproteobacteria bacterium]
MSSDGDLFLIAAPSGAGKTSLMRALLQQRPGLALSVSDTTRPVRPGEIDGEQYHFVSVEDFRRGIEEGEYLEHAEVYGNYYGTRRDRVESLWAAGRDVLLEIDVQGAEQILDSHPDVCTIFILPPSMAVLAERLRTRGSDSPEVIDRRLGEARREISACGSFRWMVVNDDFDQALADLLAIVRAWPLRRGRRQALVKSLLDETGAGGTMKD